MLQYISSTILENTFQAFMIFELQLWTTLILASPPGLSLQVVSFRILLIVNWETKFSDEIQNEEDSSGTFNQSLLALHEKLTHKTQSYLARIQTRDQRHFIAPVSAINFTGMQPAFTQPVLSGFIIQALTYKHLCRYVLCSLVLRPHPPWYVLLFVHRFVYTLVLRSLAWSFWSDLYDQK